VESKQEQVRGVGHWEAATESEAWSICLEGSSPQKTGRVHVLGIEPEVRIQVGPLHIPRYSRQLTSNWVRRGLAGWLAG